MKFSTGAIRFLLLALFVMALSSQSLMDVCWAALLLAVISQPVLLLLQGSGWDGIKRWLPPKIGVELLWLIWGILIFVGFAVNGKIGGNLVFRLTEFIGMVVIVYAVSCGFFISKFNLQKIIRFLLMAMGLMGLSALVLYFYRDMHEPSGRLGGFLRMPLTFAHSFGMIFLFLFVVFLGQFKKIMSNRRDLLLWLAVLALLGVEILLTKSRGMWGAVFLSAVIVAFIVNKRLGGAVLGAGMLIFFGLFSFWQGFRVRFLKVFDYANNSDSERIGLWKANMEMFKDHPLFGVGYGENVGLLQEYYAKLADYFASINYPAQNFTGHAHNQFIHILAGTGIFGFLIYMAFHVYFIVLAWRLYRSAGSDSLIKWSSLGVFAALLGFAFGGLTEANFEHAKVRMIVYFLWVLLVYMRSRPQDAEGKA